MIHYAREQGPWLIDYNIEYNIKEKNLAHQVVTQSDNLTEEEFEKYIEFAM